ncbi:glutamate racemase [Guggenheimella bovis]
MQFIGVFDSGLGGITVLSDLKRELPQENYIFIGDSKHAPYGEKSKEEITERCRAITEDLVGRGAKAILIACNTATSACVEELRREYSIPIVGMEPALKPAVLKGESPILVLATDYTIKNDKFMRLKDRVVHGEKVYSVSAPRLVRFVESGSLDSKELDLYLDEILEGLDDTKSVVLGCTHFLYLKEAIQKHFKHPITFFDGNHGTIERLKSLLEPQELGSGELLIENTLSEEMVERSKWLMETYRQMNTSSTGNR